MLRLIRSRSVAIPRTAPIGAPLRINDDILDQAKPVRLIGQQHFEVLAVANGYCKVQGRDVIERVAAVVNLIVHAERLGLGVPL